MGQIQVGLKCMAQHSVTCDAENLPQGERICRYTCLNWKEEEAGSTTKFTSHDQIVSFFKFSFYIIHCSLPPFANWLLKQWNSKRLFWSSFVCQFKHPLLSSLFRFDYAFLWILRANFCGILTCESSRSVRFWFLPWLEARSNSEFLWVIIYSTPASFF